MCLGGPIPRACSDASNKESKYACLHGFYCPTRGKEGSFIAPLPAREICPGCGLPIGEYPGECKTHIFPLNTA
jgi:hypothetical protein